MAKSPSREYFDYTCPDLDKIMERLRRDICHMLPDGVDKGTEKEIEDYIRSATDDIKSTITFPGREAFDNVINNHAIEIEELENKLEKSEDYCAKMESKYEDEVYELKYKLDQIEAYS